jgi:RNA ligase (TIGR02306 family)
MRKLASVQVIQEIKSIPNADRICAYRVNEWWVVDAVQKYNVNDLVIYLECDSWVPTEIAPILSKGKEPKEYQGIKGERLRTVKLKKQISQGLILPCPNVVHGLVQLIEGEDLTDILGIIKWEPPMEYLSANAKGAFPSFFPKTDQERIQNCYKNVKELFSSTLWEVTEKVEGQSHSVYFNEGEFGVCSRNLDLKDSDCTFWNTARKYDLENKLRGLGRNLVIQSEQIGPGIQGNIYDLSDYYLLVFDVYDIDEQVYLSPKDRYEMLEILGLESVPVIDELKLNAELHNCDYILKLADGLTTIGREDVLREGLVFKAYDQQVSFKAVSNEYLLEQK